MYLIYVFWFFICNKKAKVVKKKRKTYDISDISNHKGHKVYTI